MNGFTTTLGGVSTDDTLAGIIEALNPANRQGTDRDHP
jgi:hypothetical protein